MAKYGVGHYKPIKIIVDDIALAEVLGTEITLSTYDMKTALEYIEKQKPNAKIIINGKDFRLEIIPDTMKSEETQDYILIRCYGVLPKVFPGLFADKLLEPWQKAFVEIWMSDLYDRSKIWRDNPIFTTLNAEWFRKGWFANEQIEQQ